MRTLLASLLIAITFSQTAVAATANIAVAANFKRCLLALEVPFRQHTGHLLKISSASTGTLYNQIIHGAPFDVFLAADSQRPIALEQAQRVVPGSRSTYARGRLILLYRPDRVAAGVATIEHTLATANTLAIANPNTAPYGRAALQVLNHTPRPARILRAANVQQALQFWVTGGADAAIVAANSIATDNWLTLPEQWYDAIEQQLVLLKRGADNPAARDFVAFLKSPTAADIIRQHGYDNG